jgi:hypothetical protein
MTALPAFTLTITSARNPILAAHAAAIHRLARSEVESIVEYILEVGRHLAEASQYAEPGIWREWVRDEFGWAPASAFRLIEAYQRSRRAAGMEEAS